MLCVHVGRMCVCVCLGWIRGRRVYLDPKMRSSLQWARLGAIPPQPWAPSCTPSLIPSVIQTAVRSSTRAPASIPYTSPANSVSTRSASTGEHRQGWGGGAGSGGWAAGTAPASPGGVWRKIMNPEVELSSGPALAWRLGLPSYNARSYPRLSQWSWLRVRLTPTPAPPIPLPQPPPNVCHQQGDLRPHSVCP